MRRGREEMGDAFKYDRFTKGSECSLRDLFAWRGIVKRGFDLCGDLLSLVAPSFTCPRSPLINRPTVLSLNRVCSTCSKVIGFAIREKKKKKIYDIRPLLRSRDSFFWKKKKKKKWAFHPDKSRMKIFVDKNCSRCNFHDWYRSGRVITFVEF